MGANHDIHWPTWKAELVRVAQQAGFFAVRVANVTLGQEICDHYARWIANSYHGEMTYMEHTAQLRLNVQRWLPWAQSVLVFAADYYPREPQAACRPESTAETVRISKYAVGEDYHHVLRRRLEIICEWLGTHFPEAQWQICIDSSPLLERAYAVAAGIGFWGRNTMVITPRHGSYYFLACLVTSVALPPDPPVWGTCGSCTRCMDACPTQAFVAPYVLNARRCISYLSIEKRTPLSPTERRLLGEWVFGCDICQDVCPYNKRPPVTPFPEFREGRIVREWEPTSTFISPRSNREFTRRLAHSPILRPGRRRILERVEAVVENLRRRTKLSQDAPASNQLRSDDSSAGE
ncbi:MAG: tRNA epoxyqueuosine(34) reductase QueG [Candidatus Hydrogenedentota bacterium]|jgi:epoxyqueuosine reductase|nr:tRNA epoxyqueuosine(34) reductase QueG [Candidatus Sumerlaea chitinivorans]RMH27274.1 MAG: tRNA epoxyqueuosine(34) reductase QueG [Candidatus Hydrogenedentota bacterium]GIX44081.1 MAG: epoxyqueuosine reductase [Candidatus Sumerlaea sp.]